MLSTIVAGAATIMKPMAEEAVKDAYQACKALFLAKFGSAAIERIEAQPDSQESRAALREELQKHGAAEDEELKAAVKALLEKLNRHAPEEVRRVGLSVEVINAGPGSNFLFVENLSIAAGNLAHTPGYLVTRGVEPYRDYSERPSGRVDVSISGCERVSELRIKLLAREGLAEPMQLRVRGTLFPCGLLTAGWWERRAHAGPTQLAWRDDLQAWLFNGFDLWAPSWDFSWTPDAVGQAKERRFFIAQLGSGDEADSLPVIVPAAKAAKLAEVFVEGWGGAEVEICGLLGHRSQFPHQVEALDLFGGLLDYCLWIEDNRNHHIKVLRRDATELYSGYLWKCVAPKRWATELGTLSLDKTYFVWEHTDFSKPDAVKFSLEMLDHKLRYIEDRHGELLLLQKSSYLVPGAPLWNPDQVYQLLVQHNDEII